MAHKVCCHYVKALQRYSLRVILAPCLKFVVALYENIYRHEIHNFLSERSEDDLTQFW